MIQPSRIRTLNQKPAQPGRYVLYWMQTAKRAKSNHALEFALAQANALGLPVACLFVVSPNYPAANARHTTFMLQGLAETVNNLRKRRIAVRVEIGHPPEVAAAWTQQAALAITDDGWLRHQRQWRKQFARQAVCKVFQIETSTVVPIAEVSNKLEYAARTLRPKHRKHWNEYLVALPSVRPKHEFTDTAFSNGSLALDDISGIVEELGVEASVFPSGQFVGGVSQARKRLKKFLAGGLCQYATCRNDPSLGIESHMSPYLNFGQISPLDVALAVRDAKVPQEHIDAYLEQLLIRRELAFNFVAYNGKYDSFMGLPLWARTNLKHHQKDRRPYCYSREQLEACDTHDAYWNAAMREMVVTGKMHNYMRMYWGKKVLEWTRSPRRAFTTLTELNDKYFLDGRHPDGYAGVGWIFGLHDRPWTQRPIFGTVRYMAASGLERKFAIDEYVRKMSDLSVGNQ